MPQELAVPVGWVTIAPDAEETAMQQVRYSGVAMLLHWLIAAAVIANFIIPETLEGLPHEEFMDAMWPHKALGLIIFVLIVLRIIWRFMRTPPALPSSLKPWERALAKVVHTAFYVILLAMPIVGYTANSIDGSDVNVFGLFTVPRLPVRVDDTLAHQLFDLHGAVGTLLLVLIGLHVLGALKHQFIDRNGDLYRMLPFGRPKP
jgi:cytochrome b561